MAAVFPRVRPTYAVESVDNALRLLQMLRDLGEVRVKEAAAELGISPSTVHRLMQTLVFRGFAVQNESRVYLPGPSVGVAPAHAAGAKALQSFVRPHIEALRDSAQESAYFMVLTGRVVRFLLTAESGLPVHAGDRHGFVIPAHSSAGGRAALSTLLSTELDELYGPGARDGVKLGEAELAELRVNLRGVRSRGYAVSIGAVEKGIVTVAAPIRHPRVQPRTAISLSGPAIRQRSVTSPESIDLLLNARDAIERELAELG